MRHYLYLRFRVREYGNWRIAFDETASWRKQQGERNIQIYNDENEINFITLISEWEDLDKLKKFVSDPELSEKMQFSGVMEQPAVHILTRS